MPILIRGAGWWVLCLFQVLKLLKHNVALSFDNNVDLSLDLLCQEDGVF